MKIALDIMGGDYAPAEALKGVQMFLAGEPDASVHLLLIGDTAAAAPYLSLLEGYQYR
jgi:glycerol-3-phosphate acyltransferase PlsX